MSFTYGIYIYKHVESLDFVGPYDVFDISCYLNKEGRVVTIAEKTDPIICSNGMKVIPQYTFDTAPDPDLILVPGTNNLEAAPTRQRSIEWLKQLAGKTQYTAAVCTGAIILQHAGLLKNKKATTHWQLINKLKKDKTINVMPEMRYVRDGNIVTSQGISAGIDMSLWLVGQINSPEHAREVRKILQYDPAPPYEAEV